MILEKIVSLEYSPKSLANALWMVVQNAVMIEGAKNVKIMIIILNMPVKIPLIQKIVVMDRVIIVVILMKTV